MGKGKGRHAHRTMKSKPSTIDLTDFNNRRRVKYAVELPFGKNVGESRIVGISALGPSDLTHDTALDGVLAFLHSFNAARLVSLAVHFDLRMQPGTDTRSGAFLLPGLPSTWSIDKISVPANWAGAATSQTSINRTVNLPVGSEFPSGNFSGMEQVAVTDSLLISTRSFGGNARVITVVEVLGIPQTLHVSLFASPHFGVVPHTCTFGCRVRPARRPIPDAESVEEVTCDSACSTPELASDDQFGVIALE